jgi:hypothetical protein
MTYWRPDVSAATEISLKGISTQKRSQSSQNWLRINKKTRGSRLVSWQLFRFRLLAMEPSGAFHQAGAI